MKAGRNEIVEIRGRRLAVRHWGRPEAPTLFMLHGFADVSASFQFTVDALRGDWHVIAPDWRGFGASQWNNDSYWFPDYLGDLDGLMDHYAGQVPVSLIGHSMGGNLASIYAGVRAERVARLVNLEGFGLRDNNPTEAPQRYQRWLDELKHPKTFRTYASWNEFAARLCKDNPRLTPERAAFLVRYMGRQNDQGQIELTFDPHHRRVNPVLYRVEEIKACFRAIAAPVLLVSGRQSEILRMAQQDMDDFAARKACFATLRDVMVEDCGHNIHHDQPEQLASLIEEFLS